MLTSNHSILNAYLTDKCESFLATWDTEIFHYILLVSELMTNKWVPGIEDKLPVIDVKWKQVPKNSKNKKYLH